MAKQEEHPTFSEIKTSLDGLVIPDLQTAICLFVDFTPERRKFLADLWEASSPNDIQELDEDTRWQLSLFAMETVVSCNNILPKRDDGTSFEPTVHFEHAKFLKSMQDEKLIPRSLMALNSGSIMMFRHFAYPVNVQTALRSVFEEVDWIQYKGRTEESASNIFWYFVDVAETWEKDPLGKHTFWTAVFVDLVRRKYFDTAAWWVEDALKRLTNYQPNDLPRILRENGVNVDWFDPKFITFVSQVRTLLKID